MSTPSELLLPLLADVHAQRGIAVRREPGGRARRVGGRHVVLANTAVYSRIAGTGFASASSGSHMRAHRRVPSESGSQTGSATRTEAVHSPPAAACHVAPELVVIVPSPSTVTASTG